MDLPSLTPQLNEWGSNDMGDSDVSGLAQSRAQIEKANVGG